MSEGVQARGCAGAAGLGGARRGSLLAARRALQAWNVRIFAVALVLSLLAAPARADLIPLEEPCAGKKAGDACRRRLDRVPGTCVKIELPPGVQALDLECETEGDRRGPRPDPEETPPRPGTAPKDAGGCRVGGAGAGGLTLTSALLLLRPRRRARSLRG